MQQKAPYSLQSRGKLLVLRQPIVMGIVNATPDSFYAGSRLETVEGVVEKATEMVRQGATIIDIGGMSTRPGSKAVSVTEEADRVLPTIEAVRKALPEIWLSVDTYRSAIARMAVAAGADIINDITAGDEDADMVETVASLKVIYVAMHKKGNPETMQNNPEYHDITSEVLDYFLEKMARFRSAGIHDVVVDPGFGFGKTTEHNYELLQSLSAFSILNAPVLVGVSRKSMVWKVLGCTPEEALNGTTVLHSAALSKGAAILRVHDVKQAVEAIALTTK